MIVDMVDVVERIKDVISQEHPGQKVLDKNVAFVLGFNPDNLATKKSRNLVPYDELTAFCIEYKVSLNWLFFGLGRRELRNAA